MTELFNPEIHEVREDFNELPSIYKLDLVNKSDRIVELGDYIRESDILNFNPEDRDILLKGHLYFEVQSIRRFELSEEGQKMLDYILSPYGTRVRRLAEIQKLKSVQKDDYVTKVSDLKKLKD